jgi:uncharacterized membrane protein YebE (DUF533 family)
MQTLGRDVFLALAAVGWADGKLDADEADAIIRTAAEEDLDIDDLAEIDRAVKTPIDLGVLDRAVLSDSDRRFVYGVALWMSRLDGDVSESELSVLAKLRSALGLTDDRTSAIERAVDEVVAMPFGDRPHRFDLPRLRELLAG